MASQNTTRLKVLDFLLGMVYYLDNLEEGRVMRAVTIYVACWKCGRQMRIKQDDYRNGLVCGSC